MGRDLWTSFPSFLEDHCHTVSSSLVQEDGKHQLLIYFTSHMLYDVEKCYQMIEKVALTLITLTR